MKLAQAFRSAPKFTGDVSSMQTDYLLGVLERAGIDFHHLLVSTDALPNPEGVWEKLKDKPIGEYFGYRASSPKGEFYEASFWDEYWILAIRWMHGIAGSGIIIPAGALRFSMPEGWSDSEHGSNADCDYRSPERMLEDRSSFVATCVASATACDYLFNRVCEWEGLQAHYSEWGFPSAPKTDNVARPSFDKERRQLSYGGEVIKRFKLPAKNQELVLSAFEEDGWPSRIDNPIPGQRKLNQTIRDLNRNMRSKSIRFGTDGKDQGATWELR